MRITAVETFVLSNRCVLVKISTDRGIAGWGEAVAENWALATVATLERMAEHLVGRDPREITKHWQVLTRGGFYRGGPLMGSAVAGIDQALWDIKGRALGAPVHELLGGPARDAVRVYAHAGGSGRTGDPDLARRRVEQGYTLVKVAPDYGPVGFLESPAWAERFVSDLRELRDAVGPAIDIAIDFHGRLSVAQSRRALSLLDDIAPAFVEEPLRPEHSALIGELVHASPVPIATGERLYDRYEFRSVLEAGVAIVQPDLSHAGGITECFRIATQAEVYDAQIAPHCPLGAVALAACLQVDLAVPNAYAQEQVVDVHDPASPALAILTDPSVLTPVDGAIPRLTGPGLGVDVDEDAVRERVATGTLDAGSPIWTAADGSFAEW
ncbi:Mandelate racemase/muconate lactonizing protein [Beutenbergia cavernae DSM 12333]|uniref:Mandelate racemase/muconate lactonizing protein n=1 Tax=Beutenbergia cavernae (strain ATCC BAA-8 / DSM 12333 / CCUG 43141 / JCM 11478 / NBRC 16432 / NCIMB 13614 / HKI 0122) TaxID=471853 RepID=C5C5D6_BEUC1|nr:galactonate dehydratase [Beutenbergia cavernae]ACQ82276.1 Mandelate racemase/muconate lactonizing protein [Beutenbergia cavernae DSM 12333]